MSRNPWAWQDRAACRDEDLSLFFAPDGERSLDREIRERRAKGVCSQCPVRAECLDYSLANAKYGTWGGLNEAERDKERRRRQRRTYAATKAERAA